MNIGQKGQVIHFCRVLKETGSLVLGSWNQEARADSGFYRVWEAAVTAVADCILRAHTLSVLWGMHLGSLGTLWCVFILVTTCCFYNWRR